MKRVILFSLLTPAFVFADIDTGEGTRNGCDMGLMKDPLRQTVTGGYKLTIKQNPKWQDEPEAGCTGTLTDRKGKTVFETTGYRVFLDQKKTGTDFNGDKKPELVLRSDTGGGQHCCWKYHFISLAGKPLVINFDETGEVVFKKDAKGNVELWRLEGGITGYTSMARRPYARRVYQIQGETIVDRTVNHCDELLKQLGPIPDHDSDREHEETKSAVLSHAMQSVFCRQNDAALKVLNRWPDHDVAKMKKEFAESLSKDFPEAAAALTKSL